QRTHHYRTRVTYDCSRLCGTANRYSCCTTFASESNTAGTSDEESTEVSFGDLNLPPISKVFLLLSTIVQKQKTEEGKVGKRIRSMSGYCARVAPRGTGRS
ncbi:hypothetical protein PMAYCL1PPCAC_21826, partial [Pristionchus mayeri]